LLPYLKDPSLHVQAEAARSLGALRDPSYTGALKALLRKTSYWDIVSGGAISGLGASRDLKALPALESACRPGASYPARAYALRAYGGYAHADERVVPKLAALLKSLVRDSDERLAMTAISTLGGCGDFRAVPALEEARKHPNSRIKTYAEEALARIRGESEAPTEKKP
jgi:HEAT repeat protein